MHNIASIEVERDIVTTSYLDVCSTTINYQERVSRHKRLKTAVADSWQEMEFLYDRVGRDTREGKGIGASPHR